MVEGDKLFTGGTVVQAWVEKAQWGPDSLPEGSRVADDKYFLSVALKSRPRSIEY